MAVLYYLMLLTTFLIVPYRNIYAEKTSSITVSTHDITVLKNRNKTFDVLVNDALEQEITVTLMSTHEGLILLDPNQFSIDAFDQRQQTINVFGLSPGRLEVTATSLPNETWIVSDLFVRITVANSEALIYISIVCGWVYFAAWSISFYPQTYLNFKRKSVVGYNFDFLAFNMVGHSVYFVFNSGLYWVPQIQAEYFSRHPRGLNPVLLNDVLFSMHATIITILNVVQCFMYERGGQRISKLGAGILTFLILCIVVCAGVALGRLIHWLDFLYYCSYIKLVITLFKCIPQAVMNYRRKSTVGWSIGSILLDFVGSILSLLQMLLNAYNYDDWNSILGGPTKFGLAIFSITLDVIFMLQHYVFYRHSTHASSANITKDTEVCASRTDLKSL